MIQQESIRFGQPLRDVVVAIGSREFAPATILADADHLLDVDPELARQREQMRREREEKLLVEQLATSFDAACQSLLQRQQELISEMQQVAIEVATAVAARLTFEKLESDRFAIDALVRELVRRLDAKGVVTVRLHPEDAALLSRRLGNGQPLFKVKEIQIVQDESLSRGDCRAESGDVSVLSSLADQLEGLREQLKRSVVHAEIERRKTGAGDRQLRHFPDRRQTA